jgi:hypothetical protein
LLSNLALVTLLSAIFAVVTPASAILTSKLVISMPSLPVYTSTKSSISIVVVSTPASVFQVKIIVLFSTSLVTDCKKPSLITSASENPVPTFLPSIVK